MNLNERAMISALHIHMWGAARNDKKVSAEVATKHSVNARRAGRYLKHAINAEAPTYRAVKSAASELRLRHYHWTLPWSEDGGRILPAAHFEKYSSEMRQLRGAFDRAVARFVDDYPSLKDAARVELNGLYNESDYPSDIRSKFGIKLNILPLPAETDFRVDLPQNAVEEIKAGISNEIQRTTALAMRDPYERLYTHISRMVERLSDPEARFRDTLISGLVDICAVLPGLNIANDAALEDLRRRAEALVLGVNAEQLRESPTLRADVVKRAAEIQDMMAGFMGAQS